MKTSRALFLLMLITVLLLPSFSLAGQSMGHTVIGDPWWRYEPGETIQGNSCLVRMVQVGDLVVPVPVNDWFEEPVPKELEHPDRKLFLLHPQTGSYFSVAYTETDPDLTARKLYRQFVEEGSNLLPQLIHTPSGVDAVYTVGYDIPAHSYTIFDGKGGVYVIETVYTARAYDRYEDIGSRISARNYDIVNLLYLIED